ncbi:hypothetical protein RGQ29_022146 [Quercus rubra]|uniref:Uncharacterized protein n=1 Tax=Quercus rubra TaxID=3512 RepID=A0AAN7INW4_QUERU|nr:hypothetical protein RGQ29_022146 [Quercus rubra]
MEPTRSFRLVRGSSIRLGRSYSSALVPASITSDCDRITGYKRLSQSMRASINDNENEYDTIDDTTTRNKKRDDEAEKVKKEMNKMKKKVKSKWSSWLPDSEKRWPVQGW